MKRLHNQFLPQNTQRYKIASTSATYRRWAAMKQRVKSNTAYAHVIICPTWIDDFDQFVTDMGECGELSLDRKDNNLGYNKDNCRWVIHADQNRNRRNCIMYGEYTLKEVARQVGIPYGTLYHRVKKLNMTIDEAIVYRR